MENRPFFANRFCVPLGSFEAGVWCVFRSDTLRNTHHTPRNTLYAIRITHHASRITHYLHSAGSLMVKSCFSHIWAMTSALHLSTRSMPELVKDS